MKTDFKRPFTIDVGFANGTYTTCSVNGKRASCTTCAHDAAERLALKLLGPGAFEVAQIGWAGIYWEITPMSKRDKTEEVAHG